MAFGIGGFRLDAIIHYEEDNVEENVKILKWLNNYVKSKDPNAYIVGEAWENNGLSEQYLASGIDSVFNFDFAGSSGAVVNTARGKSDTYKNNGFTDAMIGQLELVKKYNSNGIDAPFLSNHDMARSNGYLGGEEDKMKLAIALYQFMTGSTFTYYGEEIGMPGSGDQDVNFRAGMYWGKSELASQPKSPEGCTITNNDMTFGSVEEQLADKNSILNYTKRILQLKAENPEIARGVIEKIESLCDGNQAAITKTYNDSTIGIVYNTSDEVINVNIAETELEGMGIRGYLTLNNEEITLKDGILTMPAQSICILK